jgi:rhodanese-related sulfurtransferase
MLGLKEVDPTELHGILQEQGENLVLIDVRTPAEAARGGIHGARNIPLHLLPLLGQELDARSRVVLYCHSGARSAQGCAFLATRGYGNVFNLRGGILGWVQGGRPVVPIESGPLNA